jgi:hypothetical protein
MDGQPIRALRRPSLNRALRGITIAAALCIVAPVLAAPPAEPRKPASEAKAQSDRQPRKSASVAATTKADGQGDGPLQTKTLSPLAPSAPLPVREESGEPRWRGDKTAEANVAHASAPSANPNHGPPDAALPLTPASPPPKEASAHAAANPYLAGWFRPTPLSELPNLAARQVGASAHWVIQSVTGLPAQVVQALPSVKRVFPTGGRELLVVNVRCPAEMVTGQYFFPANALRDAINGLLETLNDARLLGFDIRLVCS